MLLERTKEKLPERKNEARSDESEETQKRAKVEKKTEPNNVKPLIANFSLHIPDRDEPP